MLFHFSENPNIDVFRPRSRRFGLDEDSVIWAVDEAHVPAYWFPRDCPRVCCWSDGSALTEAGRELLQNGRVVRVHAIEKKWLNRMRKCRLFMYAFDPVPFALQIRDAGYWTSATEVRPLSVTPVGGLVTRHKKAGIELRVVADLRPLVKQFSESGLQFSILRQATLAKRADSQKERATPPAPCAGSERG